MSQENFESLKDSIDAIQLDEVKIPHVPVDTYLQEAHDLYVWSKEDQAKLVNKGLDQRYFDELEARCGALRHAQALWNKERFGKRAAQKKWSKVSPRAYDLKNELEHDFRFAFSERSDLLSKIKRTAQGNSKADLIQDLSDLAALGKANLPLLKAINFNEAKLDKAASEATDLSTLLAQANRDKKVTGSVKTTRDKAYAYLHEAVDKVYEAGQYVFRKDEAKKAGYYSRYLNKISD